MRPEGYVVAVPHLLRGPEERDDLVVVHEHPNVRRVAAMKRQLVGPPPVRADGATDVVRISAAQYHDEPSKRLVRELCCGDGPAAAGSPLGSRQRVTSCAGIAAPLPDAHAGQREQRRSDAKHHAPMGPADETGYGVSPGGRLVDVHNTGIAPKGPGRWGVDAGITGLRPSELRAVSERLARVLTWDSADVVQ
jgi:hypothetical protein